MNRQLVDLYGIDTLTGKPMWRIVWSEDQFEKRLMSQTEEGLFLLHPVIREVPKYRHYIKEKYILERLVLVPVQQENDLPTSRQSYEPMWTFEDEFGNYLPPRLDASKFVIDAVYAAIGKQSMAKYKDPDAENPVEKKRERVDKLQDELFGNETDIGDALKLGMGIVVPNSYDTTKES